MQLLFVFAIFALAAASPLSSVELQSRSSDQTCPSSKCSVRGFSWDPPYWSSGYNDKDSSEVGCARLCASDSKCQVYSVGWGTCCLYRERFDTSVYLSWISPYEVFDKCCAQPAPAPTPTQPSKPLVCEGVGYDKESPRAFQIVSGIKSALFSACKDLCTATDGCKSYAIRDKKCSLYKAVLENNFEASRGSPYTFHDVACGISTSLSASSAPPATAVRSLSTSISVSLSTSVPTAASSFTSQGPSQLSASTSSGGSTGPNAYSSRILLYPPAQTFSMPLSSFSASSTISPSHSTSHSSSSSSKVSTFSFSHSISSSSAWPSSLQVSSLVQTSSTTLTSSPTLAPTFGIGPSHSGLSSASETQRPPSNEMPSPTSSSTLAVVPSSSKPVLTSGCSSTHERYSTLGLFSTPKSFSTAEPSSASEAASSVGSISSSANFIPISAAATIQSSSAAAISLSETPSASAVLPFSSTPILSSTSFLSGPSTLSGTPATSGSPLALPIPVSEIFSPVPSETSSPRETIIPSTTSTSSESPSTSVTHTLGQTPTSSGAPSLNNSLIPSDVRVPSVTSTPSDRLLFSETPFSPSISTSFPLGCSVNTIKPVATNAVVNGGFEDLVGIAGRLAWEKGPVRTSFVRSPSLAKEGQSFASIQSKPSNTDSTEVFIRQTLPFVHTSTRYAITLYYRPYIVDAYYTPAAPGAFGIYLDNNLITTVPITGPATAYKAFQFAGIEPRSASPSLEIRYLDRMPSPTMTSNTQIFIDDISLHSEVAESGKIECGAD